MTAFFNRRWRVTIGDERNALDTTALRVVFAVKRSLSKDPNTAECKIYNLAESSRSQLNKPGQRVRIEAGYDGSLADIFLGDIRNLDNVYDNVDWVTAIKAGDGERALTRPRLSKGFKGKQDLRALLAEVGGAMVKNLGNLPALLRGENLGSLETGFVAHGRAVDSFAKLADAAGIDWSIQGGALQVRKRNQPAEPNAVLLSETTGLVGSPDHTPADEKNKTPRVRAKSALNPLLIPGRLVRIRSRTVTGDFICASVQHRGDSHGAEWTTEIEGVEYK
jgi:hypothetical protein